MNHEKYVLKTHLVHYGGDVFQRHYATLTPVPEGSLPAAEERAILDNAVLPYLDEIEEDDDEMINPLDELYPLINEAIESEKQLRQRVAAIFPDEYARKLHTVSYYSSSCVASHRVNIAKHLDKLLGAGTYARVVIKYSRTTNTFETNWIVPYEHSQDVIIIHIRRDKPIGHMIGAVLHEGKIDIIDPNGRMIIWKPKIRQDQAEEVIGQTIQEHIAERTGTAIDVVSLKGRPVFNRPKYDMGNCTCWTIFFLNLFRLLRDSGRAKSINDVMGFIKEHLLDMIFMVADNYCYWVYTQYAAGDDAVRDVP